MLADAHPVIPGVEFDSSALRFVLVVQWSGSRAFNSGTVGSNPPEDIDVRDGLDDLLRLICEAPQVRSLAARLSRS